MDLLCHMLRDEHMLGHNSFPNKKKKSNYHISCVVHHEHYSFYNTFISSTKNKQEN